MIEDKDLRRIEIIKDHAKTIESIKVIIDSTLYWDSIVNVSQNGMGYRLEVIENFAIHLHTIASSKKIMKYMDSFYDRNYEGLDDITTSMISNLRTYCKSISAIPQSEYKNHIFLSRGSEKLWEEARKSNDFSVVAIHLESVIKSYKRISKNWTSMESVYDSILNFNETGLTSAKLDSMFDVLKPVLLRIINDRKDGFENNLTSFEKLKKCDIEIQKQVVERILCDLGFDFESGRVDEAIYSMTLSCGYQDVRILIEYDPSNFKSALTTALHCGAQAIYEQKISKKLYGSFLASPPSMAMYEGVARMFETLIGYSKNFCTYLSRILAEFDIYVNEDELYSYLCQIKPTVSRSNADEVSYNLHIIIRYEIEKALFDGSVSVDEIPTLWKQKYKDYFNIDIESDTDGVLQDIHWFSGYFGYFPLYVVGNIYAAQIFKMLNDDIEDIDNKIQSGNYLDISNWLNNSIFKHGSKYTTEELVYMICEDDLNIDYYINYLNAKYGV